VDAGDGEALAEAIQKIASDRRLRIEMGLKGRAYAVANFSREACTGQIEAFLLKAGEIR
jgi:glycosyltransferase involved in cell wall biosynthesis